MAQPQVPNLIPDSMFVLEGLGLAYGAAAGPGQRRPRGLGVGRAAGKAFARRQLVMLNPSTKEAAGSPGLPPG